MESKRYLQEESGDGTKGSDDASLDAGTSTGDRGHGHGAVVAGRRLDNDNAGGRRGSGRSLGGLVAVGGDHGLGRHHGRGGSDGDGGDHGVGDFNGADGGGGSDNNAGAERAVSDSLGAVSDGLGDGGMLGLGGPGVVLVSVADIARVDVVPVVVIVVVAAIHVNTVVRRVPDVDAVGRRRVLGAKRGVDGDARGQLDTKVKAGLVANQVAEEATVLAVTGDATDEATTVGGVAAGEAVGDAAEEAVSGNGGDESSNGEGLHCD